jgi:hypothetical protein
VVVLTVLLPSTAGCIPHLGVSCVNHNSSRIGAITHNSNHGNFSSNSRSSSSNSSTVLIPHHHSRLPPGHHSNFLPALSMPQMREDGPLCSRMLPTKEKQLIVSSNTRGQLAKGPSEGSCTTDWPCQLHHCGGDPHGRRSASGYVLPQQTSYYYSI